MDHRALFDALRADPFPGKISGSEVVSICKMVEAGAKDGEDVTALAHRLAGAHFPGDIERAAAAFERALKQAGY
jgi:hypothetical protein